MKNTKPVIKQENKSINNKMIDNPMIGFEAWCKEFNVGLLTNKTALIEVVVGNHIKTVKLDKPF